MSQPAQRFMFPARQEVRLESFELAAPGPKEVLVRTQISLMSTGTENIVFNRLFDPGTHWDNWVKYPFYPGYSSVGVVETVGSEVTTFKSGDRIAYRVGHASHAVVSEDLCFPLPSNVAFEQAVWAALAKISFMGAKAAQYQLGDSVLVIGAGPIGQMSIRWARAAGASAIYAVDTAENRMPLAAAGGATTTIAAPIHEAKEAILKAGKGKLPRVVIDSTGNAEVFSAALGLAAERGRVVILGDTGQPTKQFLTPDVMIKGLSIVGAHDIHSTAEWNDSTITELFLGLVASGRFPMEGMTSHIFKPDQCAEAYAIANRDRAKTMGILFDWSE